MLAYQPAFDPYHTIFRMFRLLFALNKCQDIELDKFRILDFYVAFPFLAADISFKQGQTRLRKVARKYDYLRPYGGMPDGRDLFLQMLPIQKMACETMVYHQYLDKDFYHQGIIAPGKNLLESGLEKRICEINSQQGDLIELLQIICREYPLLGENGLKHRSKLMEHRYDAV